MIVFVFAKFKHIHELENKICKTISELDFVKDNVCVGNIELIIHIF